MHGLMMERPLLITDIMRFADRNYPDVEIVSVTLDTPRHRCTLARRVPPHAPARQRAHRRRA